MMPLCAFASTFVLAADVLHILDGEMSFLLVQLLLLRCISSGLSEILNEPLVINNFHKAVWSMSDHIHSVEDRHMSGGGAFPGSSAPA